MVRINNGYIIMETVLVDNGEIVLGYNMNAVNPYGTWLCVNRRYYCFGSYFKKYECAVSDMYERAEFDNFRSF